jgi:hypothetical protein
MITSLKTKKRKNCRHTIVNSHARPEFSSSKILQLEHLIDALLDQHGRCIDRQLNATQHGQVLQRSDHANALARCNRSGDRVDIGQAAIELVDCLDNVLPQ